MTSTMICDIRGIPGRAYYIPEATSTLISEGMLQRHGWRISTSGKYLRVLTDATGAGHINVKYHKVRYMAMQEGTYRVPSSGDRTYDGRHPNETIRAHANAGLFLRDRLLCATTTGQDVKRVRLVVLLY